MAPSRRAPPRSSTRPSPPASDRHVGLRPRRDRHVYVDVARRAGFDFERCGRSLLADEALLRADPRILPNATLLAADAAEAPTLLDGWAKTIVAGYSEILQIEPVLRGELDEPQAASESYDYFRARVQRCESSETDE